MKQLLFAFVIALSFSQCKKDDRFVDKSVIDAIEKKKAGDDVLHVTFIFENDVYYLENMIGEAVKLTNTPSVKKTLVRLSYDRKKIAYVEAGKEIVVISTETGQEIETVNAGSIVDQLGWSADGKTIYYRIGSSLFFHGPEINRPVINLTNGERVFSIALSPDNDWIYIRDRYSFSTGYDKELVILKSTGEEIVFPEDLSKKGQMIYVDFSGNGKDFVIGYNFMNSDNTYDVIEAYSDFSGKPDLTWETGVQEFITPSYNSAVKYIVCGFGNETFGNYIVAAKHSVEWNSLEKDKLRDEFKGDQGDIFVDWKQ